MVIVIVGGGIVGVATAYFLARRGISSVILERDSVACAASGKAGGFLAKDWCSHNEMDFLAKNGFALHMDLMKKLGSQCGYRCVDTYSVDASENVSSRSVGGMPEWIGGKVSNFSRLGDQTTTAQVNPLLLTNELFQKSQELTQNRTCVKIARVVGLEFSSDDCPRITGVRVSTGDDSVETIAADLLLVAAGPWTKSVVEWFSSGSFPSRGFGGHRAHGVIVKPKQSPPCTVDATCLFVDYQGSGYSCEPEIYPRPDGTVYVCGLSDESPVPETSKVEFESWRCARLREVVSKIAPCLEDAEVISEHACFLPLSPDGIPVIGPVPGMKGVYIGTGHSCWGILTGPITGRILAAMIARDSLAKPEPAQSGSAISEAEEEARLGDQLLEDPHLRLFDPARFVIHPVGRRGRQTTKKPT